MSKATTVLVVDDDAFMRSLLCRVLTAEGLCVTSFGSAAELLSEGDLKTADVLLLDLRMPGMSGMELHQLLQHRGVDLPVLFISGAANLATAVTAMRNGAVDFIEKPGWQFSNDRDPPGPGHAQDGCPPSVRTCAHEHRVPGASQGPSGLGMRTYGRFAGESLSFRDQWHHDGFPVSGPQAVPGLNRFTP